MKQHAGFTALRENLEKQGKIWKTSKIRENLENSEKFLGKSYTIDTITL